MPYNGITNSLFTMKELLILAVTLLTFTESSFSQEKLQIEGAIILQNSEDPTPATGTIRFNTSTNDFEGYDGNEWLSLTGRPLIGTVADIDGNSYSTVKVGDQIWMSENLRVGRFNDGNTIRELTDVSSWTQTNQPGYAWYNNNETNALTYGALYNGYVATHSRNVCPIGWHVPSLAELTILLDELGGRAVAGGFLKEFGNEYWEEPNVGGHNSSGMSLRGAGFRSQGDGAFGELRSSTFLWSSSFGPVDGVMSHFFISQSSATIPLEGDFNDGISIRCLKD